MQKKNKKKRMSSISNFRRKIQHNLVSAFPGNNKRVVFQIHIRNIHSDTFTDTDACTQKKRKDRIVTPCRQLLELLLMFCQLISVLCQTVSF